MCNVHVHTPYGFCTSCTITPGMCSIQMLYVSKDKRRQGKGQKLLFMCLQSCTCTLVVLDDMSGANQHENIYVKAGFHYEHICSRRGELDGPEMIARVSYTRRKLRQSLHQRLLVKDLVTDGCI
jgi:predicted GNAT family N-acyltransferase